MIDETQSRYELKFTVTAGLNNFSLHNILMYVT